MDALGNLTLSERKIIVGIDFGTTFSGVAWAETRRPDDIHVIDSWPATVAVQDGASSVKVPSELRYGSDGFEWGFQIPPIVERHQWFKLALNQKQPKRAAGAPNNANRDAEQLTQDYLTALHRHLIYTMEQKLGAAFRNISLEYVLTVPAIWSEAVKEKTLRAFRATGLGADVPVSLVSEPEAAAMFALHALDPHDLTAGDTFVLCDAGGGTVDLISYAITKTSPILELKEAAAGSGALCGSTFLNRKFGEFLISKLGREDGWDAETLAEAIERFDSVIKKQYSPSTHSETSYKIPVSGLPNNNKLGVKRGKFDMKSSEMDEIFEPIVEHVIKLVVDQITATAVEIKAVLLVGGFGQSNYLKQRIRSALTNYGYGIEVLQPVHAWTAVVRGAVMKGIANYDDKLAAIHVGPRVARKHYGVKLHVKYEEGVHTEDSRTWSIFHGDYRTQAMNWFIKRGEQVVESTPKTIAFRQRFPVNSGTPTQAYIKVYCDSASMKAPIQPDANVVELVLLEASLRSVTSPWPKIVGEDGDEHYVVSGEVEAVYKSASTEYTLIVDGKRYNTVAAEYV